MLPRGRVAQFRADETGLSWPPYHVATGEGSDAPLPASAAAAAPDRALLGAGDFLSAEWQNVRVNGVVRNIDAWYDAFGAGEGDALYLKPTDRVRIW